MMSASMAVVLDRQRGPAEVNMVAVCDYIDTHLGTGIEVSELARQVNLSPHHFSMLFKRVIGVPPHQYVLLRRIQAAKRHLADGALTLSELALSLGFCDQSHFSRAFRKMTGTTPGQWPAHLQRRPRRELNPRTAGL